MLEGALEQLLLQFLAPYVDGISRDKLHLGAFSGSLELKDLKVKPDALTLLGFEGFRVRHGSIRMIKLSIPWSKLYSGKVSVTVEHLHIEVEALSDGCSKKADILKDMQESKQKAIEVRLTQLCDLVEQQGSSEQSTEGSKKRGMVVRLVRKILNNITVHLVDVKFLFVNKKRGLACGLEFPKLAVLSTDQTFHERSPSEVVTIADGSMYKLMHLQELGIRMSPAGSSDVSKAECILSPISASLQLAHVPSDQVLRVKLEVATEEHAQVTLRRSQVKHVRTVQAELGQDALHLRELLVPPAEERSMYMDVEASRSEYSRLYERHLLNEWKLAGSGDGPLTPQEEKRRRLLEDAFSVRLIAREQWKVRRKVEALHSEVSRRQEEAERTRVRAEKAKAGFFGRLRNRWGPSDGAQLAADENSDVWLAPAEREQLLQDMGDESKVERVDLPQRFSFEFLLGHMCLDLVDDRCADEVQRQLLSLALEEADWRVDVRMATDHRGQDSAEWNTKICLKSFQALHASRDLLKLHGRKDPEGSHTELQLLEDSSSAAKLVLESKLQEEQNLLVLSFCFLPVEVHFLPGVVESLLDFIRASAVSGGPHGQSTPAPVAQDVGESRVEEYVEVSKQLLEAHGDRAKEVAQSVYARIPDKMCLDITIASPIVHVPVAGLGTSMFSLGQLRISTPKPCEYSSIDLSIELNHTEMRAVSVRKERFDMIQPVPVLVAVEYRSTEEENSVNITVQVAEMAVSLAPQAVQMLLSTPSAIMSVLYPPVPGQEPAPAAAPEPPELHLHDLQASSAEENPELNADACRRQTGTWRAKELAHEVLRSEGGDLLQAAAQRVEEVRSRQFRLNLRMFFDALDLTLADSIVPVLKCRAEFLEPGLILFFQKSPNLLTLNIGNGTLVVEVLNPRNGAWEPLAERFHLGLELERQAVGEDGRSTRIAIIGHEPLLLNFTPTALQRASWIMPLFLDSLGGTRRDDDEGSALPGSTGSAEQELAKYRVVNICGMALQVSFRSRHRDDVSTLVEPTGSQWQSLDEWVLPNFATAIIASMPGGQPSEALSLERAGAVSVPGSRFVMEVLAHSPSHRLVLLSTPLRIHNQTDLTLFVRFHQELTRDMLPLELPETTACDATLLGYAVPNYAVRSQFQDSAAVTKASSGGLLLRPNSVVAVPAPALIRPSQASICCSHSWLSIKPISLDVDFCVPIEVGANIDPCSVFCRGRGHGSGSAGIGGTLSVSTSSGVHFGCDSSTYVHALPTPTEVTTVAIQPTLALLNATPIGDLAIKYTRSNHENRWREASEVRIPSFTRLNIYSFPGVRREGIALIARFNETAPWSSPPLCFSRDHFKKEVDAAQTLQLRQTEKGAAAGVIVEPLNYLEMRIACPNWFVDRSGLCKPIEVDLRHLGRRLPCCKGITLLPAECMEESCQLALSSEGQAPQLHAFRMPPSWSVLAWSLTYGAYVFCVQADDVSPDDVLGAQCQVMTLRPRLMLTNASLSELELHFGDAGVRRLAPGCSVDHHWQVAPGEEDAPVCSLRFRPRREPACPWSSAVVCGDGAAGSIPYVLPREPSGRSLAGPEVWSVEVAPARGALAVSFKQGSDYVAVNRSRRKDLAIGIRPDDFNASMPIMPLPPGGAEVPYGWLKPLGDNKRRSVDVVLGEATYRVDDARLSMRRQLRKLNLSVVVTLMGTKTMLSVEDCEALPAAADQPGEDRARKGSGAQAPAGGGSSLSVEVKLSRLGVSVIEEAPTPRELLYVHFDLLRLELKKDNDLSQLKMAISEAQVDCQLPGRADSQTVDRRRDESLGLIKQERPAVIFANCADGDRAFLTLIMRRGATSSRDILIPLMDIAFDALDITIDDKWLVPLVGWIDQARGGKQRGGMTFEHIQQFAGEHIGLGYSPPALPSVVQMDHLHIAPVSITMWCAFKLQTVRFLPQYMRTAIRVLSFSGQFTLDGAVFKLEERMVPPHRGSLLDFVRGLVSEYAMNLLNNAGAMLGKSSVLNLPRVPLKLGMTGFSYMSDSLGLAFGEAASLLNQLTFDDDYVRQQRRLRGEKKIGGLQDGVVEAGKSLAQGVEGLLDVVVKPIEGAQKNGVGGFFAGFGKGAMGSFVKPISKLGQAFSDVGSGLAASVTPDTASMKRRRMRPRWRQPRLLFSQVGIVRPWSELDAELLQQLGEHLMHGVEEVVPLTQQGSGRLVLLLYPRYLVLAEIKDPRTFDNNPAAAPRQHRAARDAAAGGTSGNRGSGSSSSSSWGGAATGSTSSTAAPTSLKAGAGSEHVDFLNAIEESAQKLFSQTLKPINTVVFGVQDIESKLSGQQARREAPPGKQGADSDDDVHSPAVRGKYKFRCVKGVHVFEEGLIKLEDHEGNIKELSLAAAGLSQAAFNALVSGFRSAVSHHGGVANWDELQTVLRQERWRQQDALQLAARGGDGQRQGAGQRTLEVFEVERRVFATGEWRTPYLPTDVEMGWRWLDSSGYHHPHLSRRLKREQCADRRSPPVELDGNLFQPTTEWTVDRGPGTDEGGWKYGIAWNSSTWDAKPSLFNGVRRRRWTRVYA